MDRRRYTPSAEGLEGRALLSLFGGTSPATKNHIVSIDDLPETFQQRFNRIEHLPYYLRQAQPGRALPKPIITQLQTDMLVVVESLHNSTDAATTSFNSELRNLLSDKTLSRENAVRLNTDFGDVLLGAGGNPQQVANLQADMNNLALLDAHSPQPSILARQDYALVIQTTMSIGRPNQTPTKGTLAVNSGIHAKDNASGVTFNHNPTIVGTYEAGATRIGVDRIQIVDDAGDVLGTGVVDPAGSYSVTLSTLADGKYHLHSQSIDEVGGLSLPSPYGFVLVVRTKPTGHDRAEAIDTTVTSPPMIPVVTTTMTQTTTNSVTNPTTTTLTSTKTTPVATVSRSTVAAVNNQGS
jgi:hypothetical protein